MGLAHIIRMGGLNRVGAVTAIDFIPRNSDGFWVGTTDGGWFHALILGPCRKSVVIINLGSTLVTCPICAQEIGPAARPVLHRSV